MLLAECASGGVDLRLGNTVTEISKPDQFRVETNAGCFSAPALVLATGGLSIPKMGATGFSYDIAKQFGLRVTETRPGLVPFKLSSQSSLFDPALAGVSLEAVASAGKQSFRENILFTHRGLSGPAILQISSYWRHGDEITLDLAPSLDVSAALIERKRTRPKATVQTALTEILPARLAQAVSAAHAAGGETANIANGKLFNLGNALKAWKIEPSATEGYAKAEVTVGGIDTRDLSSKTMEARNVPGLYAIGEAVDVTGWLGGYNFQWAWASGWSAGQAV